MFGSKVVGEESAVPRLCKPEFKDLQVLFVVALSITRQPFLDLAVIEKGEYMSSDRFVAFHSISVS